MQLKTKGIVLRSTKYGETSLIVTVFTELAGLQSYMLKGIRSEKNKSKRAGLLQIGSLLDIIAEHKPQRQLQHIKEFSPHYIYQSVHEDILKNSVATFSVELLQKLLPQEETMEELFDFVFHYFTALDQSKNIANYPLFFSIQCGRFLGYNILGDYSAETPYLHASEGVFSSQPSSAESSLYESDVQAMAALMNSHNIEDIHNISLHSDSRNRLLDWYLLFLKHHTQHLGAIRSLAILRSILH
jgi:DNA repair protein RecO (recombination protein O)